MTFHSPFTHKHFREKMKKKKVLCIHSHTKQLSISLPPPIFSSMCAQKKNSTLSPLHIFLTELDLFGKSNWIFHLHGCSTNVVHTGECPGHLCGALT